MKKLLTATAASALMAGPALAQTDGLFAPVVIEDGRNYTASDLMGTRIYAADRAFEMGAPVAAGAATEWDDIGEIGDVVISAEGELEAVIIDVGGFLGIGEREVAVHWSAIQPVVEEDDPGEVFLVLSASRETLEGAPEVERQGALDAGVAGTGATMTGDETVVMAEGTEVEEVPVEGEAEMAEAEAVPAENVTVVEADGALEEGAEEVAADVEAGAEEVAEGAEQVAETVEAEAEEAAAEVEQAAETVGAEATEEAQTTTQTVEVETEAAPEAGAEVVEEGELVVVEEETPDPAEPRLSAERTLLRTPAFEREGYETVAMDELTTEDLTGMRVYGAEDEDIGEISELIMSADGQGIEAAVLDIGGFLGLGEHQIAVTLDELQIMRDGAGLGRAYVDATQEELEAQPQYGG